MAVIGLRSDSQQIIYLFRKQRNGCNRRCVRHCKVLLWHRQMQQLGKSDVFFGWVGTVEVSIVTPIKKLTSIRTSWLNTLHEKLSSEELYSFPYYMDEYVSFVPNSGRDRIALLDSLQPLDKLSFPINLLDYRPLVRPFVLYSDLSSDTYKLEFR